MHTTHDDAQPMVQSIRVSREENGDRHGGQSSGQTAKAKEDEEKCHVPRGEEREKRYFMGLGKKTLVNTK